MRREREEEVETEEEEEGDDEEEEEEEEEQKGGGSGESKVVRDIRRYYCEFCGICRSKKALIATHILSHHKDKMAQKKVSDEEKRRLQTTCSECGKSFSKPAHLKQHMQSHSLESFVCLFQRPFACPIDGCHCCYRRKDHLTRHLLTHEGKIFVCPVENCGEKFNVQANMKRHVEDLHGDDTPLEQKKELHVCPEFGCGKVFKYASKLRKHEDSHVKLDSVEVICSEPGCGKFFSSSKCLKEHILFAHRYISCEVCGSKQLKKNIKRHMRTHGSSDGAANKIKCTEGNCQHTFSNKSNLMQHIRAVHLQQQAFACRVSGCGARFAYKHVREGHEKTHFRTCTHEDFVEADEHYLSKARGGRKRKVVTAEALLRKRVVSGDSVSVLDDGNSYLRWLLAGEED
ncbi:TFTranscription factor [Nymphaea thermarum]|nr:TFTranscription factor [Nymphaea thermarum]